PAGSRILSARLDDDSPLRDEETYTVAVNDFMAGGGSGFSMLTGALVSEETGIVDLDALVMHLETLPQPVRPPAEPRLRAVTDGEGR
ncbi:MAG TPA: 5'-nucleotidase C-terminal domain-containing protein, partial [Longimicrobiales bacterium]|nr:5'-nucleotidase C-terminal domain-containing protein [Longimicrobiales bacterium]